ncbi:MAG: hypothetical protein KGL42_03225 [Betaproteobacteria bacterium]|nr:hypothetical protein [Betaproteobacteria bacterium]
MELDVFLQFLENTPMKHSRRRFIQHSLLSLPAIGALASCGGGSTALNGLPASSTQSNTTVPTDLKNYGKTLIPYSPLAKQPKLKYFTDPDFGTRMLRITDAKADWNSQIAIPVYPTTQAWNADETLLILYVSQPLSSTGVAGSWGLFDGKSYAFIQFLPINPADVEQFYWSTTNPQVLYYVNNGQPNGTWVNQLTQANIVPSAKASNGTITAVQVTQTVIHDFANDFKSGGLLAGAVSGAGTITVVSGGEDPFAMSEDNDLIGLGAYLNKNGPGGSAAYAAFSYRISSNTIGSPFTVEADVPQALPSGRGSYFYKDTSGVQILDAVTNKVLRTLPFDGTQHSDLLRNAAGDDIIVGVQFDVPSGGATGTLVWANLTKGGTVNTLIGPAAGDPYPPGGTLVSGRAYKNPGWLAAGIVGCPSGSTGNCNGPNPSVSGSPMTYLDQEVLVANVDNGGIFRVAHHRSTGNYSNASNSNYWAQPNVTISPSGTRVLFQSDWGSANPSSPVINPNAIVDTYVIELPAYKG